MRPAPLFDIFQVLVGNLEAAPAGAKLDVGLVFSVEIRTSADEKPKFFCHLAQLPFVFRLIHRINCFDSRQSGLFELFGKGIKRLIRHPAQNRTPSPRRIKEIASKGVIFFLGT